MSEWIHRRQKVVGRLIWLAMWGSMASAFGQPSNPNRYLGNHLQILDGNWGADASLEALVGADRMPVASEVPNLGNDDQWKWLVLDPSELNAAGKWLEISSANIDSLVVVSVCGKTERNRKNYFGGGQRWQTKGGVLVHDSPWSGSNYPTFPMLDHPCAGHEVYLGVKSGKQLVIPLRIENSADLNEWSLSRDLFYSMYIGIMLVMLLYNLVLYFTVEDRTYLVYVLFLVGVAGSQLFLEGYQWLVPGLEPGTWMGQRSVHLVGIYSGVTTIFFVNRFLDLSRTARRFFVIFNCLLVGYAVAFVAVLFGKLNAGYDMINMMALGAILVVPASIQVRRQGHKSAMFLLTAFSLFFASVMVFSLKEFGLLPHTTWTKFAMPLGSMVEVVLLSIALADRINQLKKESAKAREEQLRVSRLNEKMTREQNEVLEQRVGQRTEELEERNERLKLALDELKLAQDQLIQSEKMASIGQLTAGIAHELNNPINFVSSSAVSLRRDFEDVLEVLNSLQKLTQDDPEISSQLGALKSRMKEMDIEFTMREIDELLTGIDDGTTRTAEIVKGLRIFSRMDGDATVEANLNELLESTLVILRSTLKNEVNISVNLAPNVPTISCQPGKLNQVFMNLISNAAQATTMKALSFEDRLVRIRTRTIVDDGKEWVQVAVEDNGVGMTDEVKSQIFDPFFTTKQVGEGTGLGLSIVKGILDDHGASLDIESQPGKGSTFMITFPT